VLEKTTETGLLPEQVGKESGKPVWVYGLTWSHSMFVLALFKLMEAGLIKYTKNLDACL
jgi:GH15 family glucan-1,4-alpha-glucosidase